ncbi:MAG: hypothetical protein OXN88_12345 [Chloroflexota bacterium]|nr:hypothetical protein [Chloroflexota bacterium]
MNFPRPLALLLLLLPLLAACGDTGNEADDAKSAQRLLPNLAGYTATDVDTSIDSAFAALGGAALMGGQFGITAAIAKAEQILQCFQDRGALAARWYQQSDSTLMAPKVGAALVINQSRVSQELINCALGGQEDNASAQTFAIEPCASAGTLNYQGDTISYVYVGSHPDVCGVFQLHYDNLAAASAESVTAGPSK